MLKELDTREWEEAFCGIDSHNPRSWNIPDVAVPGQNIRLDSINRKDVIEIFGLVDGEYDRDSWIIYGKLKDKRFFYLEGWCDYTGWD